ncbi:MAG TPA: hypothetical protein PKJ63_01440 [Cyclobacteriaceae bacterium]|nr:hypothetical protein [Cyclobacteriaceae bacterium]
MVNSKYRAIIALNFDYRNHLDEVKNHTLEFPSIHQLRNYFRWDPNIAMILKHQPEDPDKLRNARATNVRLFVTYQGECIWFKDAVELEKNLSENKELFDALT